MDKVYGFNTVARSERFFVATLLAHCLMNECDLASLKNRSYYKVSNVRWSDNWITLDNIIRRYIELSNFIKVIDDEE